MGACQEETGRKQEVGGIVSVITDREVETGNALRKVSYNGPPSIEVDAFSGKTPFLLAHFMENRHHILYMNCNPPLVVFVTINSFVS